MKEIKQLIVLIVIGVILVGCGSSDKPKPTPPPALVPTPVTPPSEIVDIEMVDVPAGEFTMGCDSSDSACQTNNSIRKVYLDAYKIDKYKVTYRRYQECLDAGECTPLFAGSGCNAGMEWNADHPVNCVNFQQAKTYCEYDNKTIPTEAQWAKAARGIDARRYPWGNEAPSCDLAVINRKVAGNSMGPGCGAGTTQPVGSKPQGASPYGAMDMAGNLFEWTADWFDENVHQNTVYENPMGPAHGEHKVLRGSSWLMRTDDGIASVIRSGYSPLGQGYVVGFRCVSDS